MNPPSPFDCSRHRAKGSALIITLFFVVLISIIIIGFLMEIRVEGMAAAAHFERARAALFARTGVETAVATLGQYTTSITTNNGIFSTNGNSFWTSQPGQLLVSSTNSTPSQWLSTNNVLLSSGGPSASPPTDPTLASANINIQTLVDSTPPSYLLTHNSTAMSLRWVYVRQDGSYDLPNPALPISSSNLPTESPVLNNFANPIIGRFAYWTDDESNKINLNLAWKRNPASSTSTEPTPAQPGDPSQVSLLGMTLDGSNPFLESSADALHNWITQSPARYFNSFLDAGQVSPTISQMINYNKFSLTHYNHDPDTTYFGQDRILLTTNRNLVPHVTVNGQVIYLRKFLDIMRDDLPTGVTSLDPGNTDHIAGGQLVFTNPANPASGSPLDVELPNKLNATISMLTNYIGRTDWPIAPKTSSTISFTGKYSNATATMLALNIIDYVRAKESPTQVVAPLHVCIGNSKTTDPTNYQKYTISQDQIAPNTQATNFDMGVCRMPSITEMGAWVDANGGSPPPPPSPLPTGWPVGSPTPKLYKLYLQMEVYLPSKYGITSINLVPTAHTSAGSPAWFMCWPAEFNHSAGYKTATDAQDTYYWVNPDTSTANNMTQATPGLPIFQSDIVGGSSVLHPGQFTVIQKQIYCNYSSTSNPGRAIRQMALSLCYGIMDSKGLLVSDTLHNLTSYNNQTSEQFSPGVSSMVNDVVLFNTPDSTTVPSKNNMNSLETDDPRASFIAADWTYNTSGNSFGIINSISTLGNPPSPAPAPPPPQQDADSDGNLTDASTYMPAPAGTTVTYADGTVDNNTLGRVTSLGELGYIYTGAGKSSYPNPTSSETASTSYRTLRLQPNYYGNTATLPDWALLDLFSVPRVPNSTSMVPNTPAPLVPDSVNNPNAALYTPYGVSLGGRINLNAHISPFSLTRQDALVALLTDAPNIISPATPATLASSIYTGSLATANNNFGKNYGYASMKGYAGAYDMSGEVCEIQGVADGGEQSEGLIRDIGNLITTRGDVFTVYTIGQALKQTPQGKLVITAENRQQFAVERYYDNRDTPADSTDDVVHFRPVYSRILTP